MTLLDRETGGSPEGESYAQPNWYADDESEAEEVLEHYVHEGFASSPRLRDAILTHVLRVACPERDFELRIAAAQAIVRRMGHAKTDGVRVVSRPKGRAIGEWELGEPGGTHHGIVIESLEPLRMSCDCDDFLESSLGLCKHGLAALATIRPTAWDRAKPATPRRPTLTWDPIEPLVGSSDGSASAGRLGRLRVVGPSVTIPGSSRGAALARSGSNGRSRGTGRSGEVHARLAHIRALLAAIAQGSLVARPAAIAVIEAELAAAHRIEDAERTRDATTAALETLRRPLYPYQREGVMRFLATGRLLLGDDMGLGKTTQAAAATHALFHTGQLSRALLIVPASLKPQWRREWIATTDVPIVVVDGPPEARARIYASFERGVLVIGYEQLLRDVALVSRFDPELAILDEAQRIKNRDTRTAACVKALRPRFRLALTGTPMENRLAELGSIVDFVDRTALMPSWRLAAYHTLSQGDAGEGVSGARNLGQLRERLAPVMLRRVRSEVVTQLPERTDTRVPVRMTPEQWAEHVPREARVAALLRIAEHRALTLPEHQCLMKLFTEQRIICNGLAQFDFDEAWERCAEAAPTDDVLASMCSPKLAALRTLVEELCVTQGRKVVVFSQWRRMLRLSEWAVRDVLARAGLRASFFTGAESSKLRERALVDFHDDPDLAVLFLTDAGGVGLNLQRAASACIQLELPWNPAVMEQRIGRIHRTGQSRPIDVYHLVSEGGLESRIAELIGNKRALFSGLFEGASDEIRFVGHGSFVDRLRTMIGPDPEEGAPIEVSADGETIAIEPAMTEPTTTVSEGVETSVAHGEQDGEATTDATPPGPASTAPSSEAPRPEAPSAPITQAVPESPPPTVAAPACAQSSPFRIEPRPDGSFRIDGVTPALAGLLMSLAQALVASTAGSTSGAG